MGSATARKKNEERGRTTKLQREEARGRTAERRRPAVNGSSATARKKNGQPQAGWVKERTDCEEARRKEEQPTSAGDELLFELWDCVLLLGLSMLGFLGKDGIVAQRGE